MKDVDADAAITAEEISVEASAVETAAVSG
jgi:hypothetical protein